MEQTGEQLIQVVPCRLLIVIVQGKATGFDMASGYNHSNFFLGAHWVEERLAEEKRIDNTHKQAETFGVTQANAHDWDKWSRLRTAHPRCALQIFYSKGARQGKLDLTWLQNYSLMLTSDSNVENKALWQLVGLVVRTYLHKDYRSVIKGLRRKRTILCQ
ncbi:hypothetical protein PoB_001922300 [Plakobranchus ocellatus]|uniref:Uncharacterized protein n=1 Tax=Plakobranchus ocellatus TaxID=259542 RepID=A0AAV3ZDB5_9GAST|nr:hypothetical protein PoB_001922300 [Plakobranchus ocellatus]